VAEAEDARSLSAVVADLVRRGLESGPVPELTVSPVTGLPLVSLGRVITSDDVRALEDET
jgi:hypothetical protein